MTERPPLPKLSPMERRILRRASTMANTKLGVGGVERSRKADQVKPITLRLPPEKR